ncbi:MAG TPA: YggS family pyridoxal phosphate-dependent enzyme [Alkalispirochaeta sp.]|nr:YggS family pyridoxal phosphate-dependent enzyme [Alkalispirochaeta sp.]
MGRLADNFDRISEHIEQACVRAGRSPAEVRLMAVSKRQPVERIREAASLGLRLFGESRVQETAARRSLFPEDAEIHLIGHLQRNKARDAAHLYSAIDSIDAERTAQALDQRLQEQAGALPVLLEVNTSGEASKHGVRTYEELAHLVQAVHSLPTITIRGLMTIGPVSTDERRLRGAFASLRELSVQLNTEFPELTIAELSMGMSNDYHYAVMEGATTVRVGTALFGARDA